MPAYLSPSAGSSEASIGVLVDRVYRDYLESADDQAVIVTLTADAGSSATTFTFEDATLAPDEEDLLAPGVLVEVGLEQMRVTDVDATTNTITVTRGVNGTEAVAISSGDEMRVAPMYPRQTVFDAVADNIVGLYPDLRRLSTQAITSASGLVEVSADVVSIAGATYLSASRPVPANVELYRNWPASSTGQALLFSGTPYNKTVYVTYEARFERPTTEDDVAGDLGVDAAWERIVVVGAAAQVVSGRDLDPLSQEYLVEQMEAENLPVGSGQRVRNGLLQLHQAYLTQARRNLRADRVTPVVVYR